MAVHWSVLISGIWLWIFAINGLGSYFMTVKQSSLKVTAKANILASLSLILVFALLFRAITPFEMSGLWNRASILKHWDEGWFIGEGFCVGIDWRFIAKVNFKPSPQQFYSSICFYCGYFVCGTPWGIGCNLQ